MLPSEEFTKRYKTMVKEADALGRIIGVHRLRLSQQIQIEDIAPANAKHDIPMLAAAVCEIDGVPVPFPKSRGELNAIIDTLDIEGITAVAIAWKKLNGAADGAEPESDVDKAKK